MIDLTYLIQVNIFLTITGVAVLLAVRHQPYHQLNRGLILSTVVLSLVLPLMSLGFGSSTLLSYELSPIYINQLSNGSANSHSGLNAISGLEWTYIIGATLSLLYFLYNLINLIKLLGVRNLHRFNIQRTEQHKGSSSFFKTIVLESFIDKADENMIKGHEMVHVHELHSLDKIFMRIIQIVCWFNPVVYLLSRKLEAVHEFRADEVIANESNKEAYSYLLISQATGVNREVLMNKFSKSSLLKQRIMMLNKANKTNRKLSYWMVIPALILAILVVSCVKDTGETNTTEPATSTLNLDTDVYKEVDEMPVFAEGNETLIDFFQREVEYPESCKSDEVTGKVLINFIVDEEGTASNFEVVKSPDERLTMAALDVMAEMPKWTPGKVDGQNVKTQLTLPIMYALE